ncbi:hypothetical protein [Acidithrix sp. C25]|uniref:primosomal protein N' family DNA-binding protein n=1 Tax=Acidithrix sp. C25 TaxID=1671482 RepID=UPI00191BB37E|nr:hypothetical protein [Acidithrix sp. C25]CAG4931093.1 unnamed protein product [Acidithrix sp. C25]
MNSSEPSATNTISEFPSDFHELDEGLDHVGHFVGVRFDVVSLERVFSYSVPKELIGKIGLGTPVRAPLNNRSARGWVVEYPHRPTVAIDKVLELYFLDNYALSTDLYELCRFGAWRYGSNLVHFLKHARSAAASTPYSLQGDGEGMGRANLTNPPTKRSSRQGLDAGIEASGGDAFEAGSLEARQGSDLQKKAAPGSTYIRISPCESVEDTIFELCIRAISMQKRVLVLFGNEFEMQRSNLRLGQMGLSTYVLERGDTKKARSQRVDASCIISSRIGVFAPIGNLGAIVVVDPADSGHKNSSEPTWESAVIAQRRGELERCDLISISGYPSPEYSHQTRIVTKGNDSKCWPKVAEVDLNENGGVLVNSDLVHWINRIRGSVVGRDKAPVLLIHNRKGKINRFKCTKCKKTVLCEACSTPLIMGEPYSEEGKNTPNFLHHYEFRTEKAKSDFEKLFPRGLICPKCRLPTPVACGLCKSTRIVAVSFGTTRIADELESILSIKVPLLDEKNFSSIEVESAEVVVGTVGALTRLERVSGVGFVDFDQFFATPSFHSTNRIFGHWYRAARLLFQSGFEPNGESQSRILIQSRDLGSDLLNSMITRSPKSLLELDRNQRKELDLPPYCALATFYGDGASLFSLSTFDLINTDPRFSNVEMISLGEDRYVIKALDHDLLSGLIETLSPYRNEVHLHVDPREI